MEADIDFFCEALDEELAAHDRILEEEQLERVLALLDGGAEGQLVPARR